MDRALQVLWIVISMFHQIRNLIFLQCSIAMMLWVGLWFYNPFALSIHDRIEKLPPTALQNIAVLSKQSVLTDLLEEKNEDKLKSEIIALSNALEWKIDEIHLYPRKEEKNRIPVDMRWQCIGDPIKLPIYLEGIRRLSALGTLERLEISFVDNSLDIQLRFFRSAMVYPDWIEEQNLNEKEKALLRQSWKLAYWKRLRVHEKIRREENKQNSPKFLLELSRQLTLYRNTEHVMEWSRQKGFTDKSFSVER